MKSFTKYITEALDKPYPYVINRTSDGGAYYEFDTEDDREGQINFDVTDYSGWVTVEISFSIENSIAKTGGGDQFRIFATVKAATDDYMRKSTKNIDRIFFTADKPMGTAASRVSLYRKFASKMAKAYGMKLDQFDAGNVWEFELVK